MKLRHGAFSLVAAWILLAPAHAIGQPRTITWAGSSTYLLGANYPWYNYGTDFGTGGWGKYTDWKSITADFQAMHQQGVHVARWWVFSDGRYAPEFARTGAVTGLDSAFLPNIDQALQIAADNHVYLLLTLVDSSIWNAASSSGGVTMGGHSAIVTNPTIQQSYLDLALKPLLQHVAASKNRQFVLGYDIVNEPEGGMAGYWGGANLATPAVQDFVKRCASYVKTYGGGALSTVGSAMPQWVATWKGLGLDFYQIHYYPGFDTHGPGSGLPTCSALKLDKPCIVGEFATVDASYGPHDTAPLSARWYLDTILAYGYAGALGWSDRAGDNASHWSAFQPVYTPWAQAHSGIVGPP